MATIQSYPFDVSAEARLEECHPGAGIQKELKHVPSVDSLIRMELRTTVDSEENAALLSAAHEHVKVEYRPLQIIEDGCSGYYDRLLFPLFNEFEHELRSILRLGYEISLRRGDIPEDKKDSASDLINERDDQSFDSIFKALFYDSAFLQGICTTVNKAAQAGDLLKNDLIDQIKKEKEILLWDCIVGKEAAPVIRNSHGQIRARRNDVMHAHEMSETSYEKTRKLILIGPTNLLQQPRYKAKFGLDFIERSTWHVSPSTRDRFRAGEWLAFRSWKMPTIFCSFSTIST